MESPSQPIRISGPYRRLTWWDVAPWMVGAALAFFLFGFHIGINTQARIDRMEESSVRAGW